MDHEDITTQFRELVTGARAEIVWPISSGSVARGEASNGSDIDVAILLPRSPEGRLTDFRFDLDWMIERTTGFPAQVVVFDDAPPDLVHRVLRDGRLLVDRDRFAYLRFEVRARKECFDLLPTLQLHRRTGSKTS